MFIDFNTLKIDNTLDREAFMLNLASMWGSWASKETMVNAARKIGKLSVELMQQDK